MDMRDLLTRLRRSGIALEIADEEPYRCGGTRFGGRPDVPPGFVWPCFEGTGLEDGEKKNRPLAFLAQFALEEMRPFDTGHLLPDHGVLSFFYEVESQPWGFDPQDAGCARVFWFEDAAALAPAEYPPDLSQEARFPALHIGARQAFFYPQWEDFELAWPDAGAEDFEEARDALIGEAAEDDSRLLGWRKFCKTTWPWNANWLPGDIIWATGAMCRTRFTGAPNRLRWTTGCCCSSWGRLQAGISN